MGGGVIVLHMGMTKFASHHPSCRPWRYCMYIMLIIEQQSHHHATGFEIGWVGYTLCITSLEALGKSFFYLQQS